MQRSFTSGALAIVLVTTIAGCTTGGATTSSSAGTPESAPPSDAPGPVESTAASSAPSGPVVIEDAGLETNLAPGTYTSRLFRPEVTFDLAEGWFRRDTVGDRTMNLRRAPDGAEDITFISGVDFLQCGATPVIEDPTIEQIVAGIAGSEPLAADDPTEIPVGDLTGTAFRLKGGGEPVSDEDFGRMNEFGCVLSLGDVPFPEESLWVTLTPDAAMELVVLDVAGTTVLIRSRPPNGPAGPGEPYEAAHKLLESAAFD